MLILKNVPRRKHSFWRFDYSHNAVMHGATAWLICNARFEPKEACVLCFGHFEPILVLSRVQLPETGLLDSKLLSVSVTQ